jgi:hypothetical protein
MSRTEPFVLEVDLARHPVQRGLARAVGRHVHPRGPDRREAPRAGADGDEPRRGAGLERGAEGLEEHDGAEDVDLPSVGWVSARGTRWRV